MTTVVMRRTPDDVIAGWDSLSVLGNVKSSVVDGKVWAQGGVVYGFAGSVRLRDLIETVRFPMYGGGDRRLWIIREWVPVMLDAVRGDPFAYDGEKGLLNDFSLLMVVGGRVFELDAALSPSESAGEVSAIGSGSELALGALEAGCTVLGALSAAAKYDLFTGGDLVARSVNSMLREEPVPEVQVRFDKVLGVGQKTGVLLTPKIGVSDGVGYSGTGSTG